MGESSIVTDSVMIETKNQDASQSVPLRPKQGMTFHQLDSMLDDVILDVSVRSLTTCHLNQAVAEWRVNPRDSGMTPNEALDHLSLYSPHILPDVNTYGMIVDIAIKWAKNPLEGPHFAQAVLDCMNKEAKTSKSWCITGHCHV
jgi:hypothetical protein